MKRCLSGPHGRGAALSAQESADWRSHRGPGEATAAESLQTARTAMMPEVVGLALRLRAQGDRAPVAVSWTLEADR
eukprot:5243040-Pyramimonas_sp.AAC.1